MATLHNVYDFVKSRIASSVADSEIDAFLMELNNPDVPYSARLLCCIGIDIKTYEVRFKPGSRECDLLFENFKRIIINTNKIKIPKTFSGKMVLPYIRFSLSLAQSGTASCKPSIKNISGGKYTRISTFFSYLNYVVKPNILINPDIPADLNTLDETTLNRYYITFAEKIEFNEVNVTRLTSSTGWVFTTDKSELEGFFSTGNLKDAIDSIGYYIDKLQPNDKFLYLEYPTDFDEHMLQPTALTGDWGKIDDNGMLRNGNDYFLSYRDSDSWGRTYSVSGTLSPVKERVHLQFDHNNVKKFQFRADGLGPLSALVSKAGNEQILEEALKRFENA